MFLFYLPFPQQHRNFIIQEIRASKQWKKFSSEEIEFYLVFSRWSKCIRILFIVHSYNHPSLLCFTLFLSSSLHNIFNISSPFFLSPKSSLISEDRVSWIWQGIFKKVSTKTKWRVKGDNVTSLQAWRANGTPCTSGHLASWYNYFGKLLKLNVCILYGQEFHSCSYTTLNGNVNKCAPKDIWKNVKNVNSSIV